jgi:hypothetical protein
MRSFEKLDILSRGDRDSSWSREVLYGGLRIFHLGNKKNNFSLKMSESESGSYSERPYLLKC